MTAARHTGISDSRRERAVTVSRPAQELYAFWRRMENLGKFMEGVDEVIPLDDRRYRWISVSSDGRRQEWEAEILEEEEGRRLSWATVKESEISAWGAVRFAPAPGGRGTEVFFEQRFEPPPSSRVTEWFWNLFGEDPGIHIQQSLRRFQQLMETGEIARY